MRVLYVSYADVRGGRFNGYALLEAQDSFEGFAAEMAVWRKDGHRDDVHDLHRGRVRLANGVTRRLSWPLGLDGLLGLGGASLLRLPAFSAADVIHLQVIHNGPWFSVAWLPWLARQKPVVWTIHDVWPMTGTCQHSASCSKWLDSCGGRCPRPLDASPLDHYSPALLWQAKRLVYSHSSCRLIVASDWTRSRVERSPLLRRFPRTQIPFGVDLDVFSPVHRGEARAQLGLDDDEPVIAFRGVSVDKDNVKGMISLQNALRSLDVDRPTTLLIVDDGRAYVDVGGRYRVRDLGWMDEQALGRVLAAADVFVVSLDQESFCLMAAEAMAAGTPMIAFEGTAAAEIIRPPEGGVLAPAREGKALAATIRSLLADRALRLRLRRSSRLLAEREYGFETYVRRHLAVYDSVCAAHPQAPSAPGRNRAAGR